MLTLNPFILHYSLRHNSSDMWVRNSLRTPWETHWCQFPSLRVTGSNNRGNLWAPLHHTIHWKMSFKPRMHNSRRAGDSGFQPGRFLMPPNKHTNLAQTFTITLRLSHHFTRKSSRTSALLVNPTKTLGREETFSILWTSRQSPSRIWALATTIPSTKKLNAFMVLILSRPDLNALKNTPWSVDPAPHQTLTRLKKT